MSSRNYEAIITRWDNQSLDDTFTGGIWADTAPSAKSWPYVTLITVSPSPAIWVTGKEIRVHTVQFTIHEKVSTSTDPIGRMGSLMRTLRSAFDFAPLTVSASDGKILECRPGAETFFRDDEDIYNATIDYTIRRELTANYSPS